MHKSNKTPQLETAALTIAGSDSSGGAGIQADLKTFARFGVYGTSVITAVTAQNTLGVDDVTRMDPPMVSSQLRLVLEDIPVRAAKTGMLASAAIIDAIVEAWPENEAPALIVDPVMVATSGARLLDGDAVDGIRSRLLPRADLATPNLPEARLLAGDEKGKAGPDHLAERILETGCRAVLIKDGHGTGKEVIDRLYSSDGSREFSHPRQEGQFHGTGCCLSAAITALLARGAGLEEAIGQAIDWLAGLISRARMPLKGSSRVMWIEDEDSHP